MRHIRIMFLLLTGAFIAPLVPDDTGTNMIVAHLFITGVTVTIFLGVMHLNRDR